MVLIVMGERIRELAHDIALRVQLAHDAATVLVEEWERPGSSIFGGLGCWLT